MSRTLQRRGAVFAVYVVLLGLAGVMFQAVPGGFIPTQDKLYLMGGVKLPEGASLDRTNAVIRQMSEIALATDGVDSAIAFPGLNALQFTNTPNTGVVFLSLDAFRRSPSHREGDQRRTQREVLAPAGRLRLLDHAAADPRPWAGFRLFAVRAGPRRRSAMANCRPR